MKRNMLEQCELFKLIPKDKLSRIFKNHKTVGAECDYTFLGFEEVYKAVTMFVPKSRVIIDLGCGYAFQAWCFQDYRKYIAVDYWDMAYRVIKELDIKNALFCEMSIQDFIKDAFPQMGYALDEVFAICSYVEDDNAREMVRKSFPHCLVYYPTGKEI